MKKKLENLNNGYGYSLSNADELFIEESNVIKELAEKDSCVIIGRCADFVLKDKENIISIFIYFIFFITFFTCKFIYFIFFHYIINPFN